MSLVSSIYTPSSAMFQGGFVIFAVSSSSACGPSIIEIGRLIGAGQA